MNKQELLQFEKLASLTPREIEKKQPAVFLQLSTSASVSLKDTIENKLKNAPAVIKDSLAKINFAPNLLFLAKIKPIS